MTSSASEVWSVGAGRSSWVDICLLAVAIADPGQEVAQGGDLGGGEHALKGSIELIGSMFDAVEMCPASRRELDARDPTVVRVGQPNDQILGAQPVEVTGDRRPF